jgi:hypothetical protein
MQFQQRQYKPNFFAVGARKVDRENNTLKAVYMACAARYRESCKFVGVSIEFEDPGCAIKTKWEIFIETGETAFFAL